MFSERTSLVFPGITKLNARKAYAICITALYKDVEGDKIARIRDKGIHFLEWAKPLL